MANITIDGKEYDVEQLSANAREQVASIQAADQELNRLNVKVALTQTARNAYAQSLSSQLPEQAAEVISEEMITIDDRPYRVADFSDKAKAELSSLQACDSAVATLKAEAAIAQTARNAYASALKTEL